MESEAASVGGLFRHVERQAQCRLLALFGHGPLSELSPFSGAKRTGTESLPVAIGQLRHGADQLLRPAVCAISLARGLECWALCIADGVSAGSHATARVHHAYL